MSSVPLRGLSIITWGCQMNLADSNRAAALLASTHRLCDLKDADLVLLNTCSVRDKPQQKVLSALGRLKTWKNERPGRLIGVMGCVAQQMKDELFAAAAHVDLVLGPDGIDELPRLVEQADQGTHRGQATRLMRCGTALTQAASLAAAGPAAYVNITKGCDKFCTYCIVPFTRGREHSRQPEVVMQEVHTLADQGVLEITLLGQNVTGYGRDFDGHHNLASLVTHLLDREPRIRRLRFLTSHPRDTGPELWELFADPRVMPYLHLPLQAGDDQVLLRMGRGYTLDQYRQQVEAVRRIRPDVALASDFIVGFPGETREQFEKTLYAVEQIGYHSIYSFVYSPRPRTKAALMDDSVPREEKLAWLQELQSLQARHTMAALTAMVGRTVDVLVEGQSVRDPGENSGRTPCNKVINLPARPGDRGRILAVTVTDTRANSLRGMPADAPATQRGM